MKTKDANIKSIFKNRYPILILLVAAVSLFFRAHLSFCWSDESFYFSTTDRFLKGDLIFIHEWFPTQLVSLILLPFQWIYRAVTGSNDGVILYFRSLYVIYSFALSCYIFRVIRKNAHSVIALCAGLWYLYYVHLNIATLSYYTISMSMFLLCMLLIYDSFSSDKRKLKLFLSGTALALSVLSLPTLALPYFVTAFLVIVCSLIWKRYSRPLIQGFLLNLGGILVPAAMVLLYVLPTTGISGILKGLPYVLSDEEHQTSLVYPFKNFFISVYDVFGKGWVLASVLLFIICLLLSTDKVTERPGLKEDILWKLKAGAFFVDTLLFIHNIAASAGHTGFSATVLLLYALPLFALTPTANKNMCAFILFFMGGMVFSMTFSYSSLCDLYVLSIGHNIAVMAGILFIYDFIACVIKKRALALPGHRAVFDLIISISVSNLLICSLQNITLRYINIYRDAPVSELTSVIEKGPAKGLYTTPEHLSVYTALLNDIQEYDNPGGYIFFSKLLPWGYLATDMRCAAPTTWRTSLSSDRLKLYYDEHPDRLPDVVYVLDPGIGSYETSGDVVNDPLPNLDEAGGYLGKLLDTLYTPHEASCGTVYVRSRVGLADQHFNEGVEQEGHYLH